MNLYLFPAVDGLKHENPTTRAAGIAILSSLSERRIGDIMSVFGSVYALVEDQWWEVQGMLVKFICHILDEYDIDVSETNKIRTKDCF